MQSNAAWLQIVHRFRTWCKGLIYNIRFYVLLLSYIISLGILVTVFMTVPEGTLRTAKLTQTFALTALCYLYLSLMATPLIRTFKKLPFRGEYVKARRALGVSTAYFALIHTYFAFFGELGGFAGLPFLDTTYLFAITLSFLSLCILLVMAATSFDFMVKRLTYRRWKFIHRFAYLAGVMILVHAMLLGSHFTDLNASIPQLLFVAVSVLLFLDAKRLDGYLSTRFHLIKTFGMMQTVVLASIIAAFFFLTFGSSGTVPSLGIHAQHILLAKQAQQAANTQQTGAKIPSLQGDKTKRFSVSFDTPSSIQANTDTLLSFRVNDATNGNEVMLFQRLYEKVAHLIIVDSQLTYFTHIHPTQTDNGFSITTQFPHEGLYHVYIDFQPFGAIEQQFGFTLTVGNTAPRFAQFKPDTKLTKPFGAYEVSLSYPQPLIASELSIGNQQLTFFIRDKKTKKPIQTLKPYLAAFGHLVMINQQTFDYIHVHPTNLTPPLPESNGGPQVSFLPLGLYGPIKPGIYRVFAQFNPNNKLFTADFTVKIE